MACMVRSVAARTQREIFMSTMNLGFLPTLLIVLGFLGSLLSIVAVGVLTLTPRKSEHTLPHPQ